MSLRRRIAGAAALAVAAVAVTLGVVGYVSTRSHLVGEVRDELRERAAPFLRPHNSDFGEPSGGQNGAQGPGPGVGQGPAQGALGHGGAGPAASGAANEVPIPPAPSWGGAPGYFQLVYPDGTAVAQGGGTHLPVDAGAIAIARNARGSSFSTARVNGVHLEVLTVGDPYDHYAVQVALPLTGVDSVLSGLALTYVLLVGGGILLAALLGAAISRSALAPVERFLRRTEDVTRSLNDPTQAAVRIEEQGASELRRLAVSFNRTLDALERSVDAQRQLIADASHELRTPISALRSDIQIFLDAERLPQAERVALQSSIVAELDELTQLVSDVLELARASSLDGATEELDLDLIVREAVDRARRRAPQLDFAVTLEPTRVTGVGDRVSRAVSNLIDNARKWSPPEGEIEVRLEDGVLSVRDHGPGFQQDDLAHVFDRFYRAPSARGKPGSGLGLAIVKQAAEAYGGFARAQNAPGGGALVSVSFAAPAYPSVQDARANSGRLAVRASEH